MDVFVYLYIPSYSGEDDMQDIMKEVIQVKANYKAFGMMLGLSYPQLEDIQKSPLFIVDNGAALTEVILTWLRQKYNTVKFGVPTWRRIVEAIDSEAGGNNHALAKEIATHHPGKTSAFACTCVCACHTQTVPFVPYALPQDKVCMIYCILV